MFNFYAKYPFMTNSLSNKYTIWDYLKDLFSEKNIPFLGLFPPPKQYTLIHMYPPSMAVPHSVVSIKYMWSFVVLVTKLVTTITSLYDFTI